MPVAGPLGGGVRTSAGSSAPMLMNGGGGGGACPSGGGSHGEPGAPIASVGSSMQPMPGGMGGIIGAGAAMEIGPWATGPAITPGDRAPRDGGPSVEPIRAAV